MPIRSMWRRPISTAGIAEVVHGAVLEPRVAGARHDHVALHVRDDDGAAAEPGPLQALERSGAARSARRRRSGSRTSCRTRSRRSPACQIDRSSRLVGTNAAQSSSTSQPRSCASVDPFQRVLDAGEVGLRRVGEQVAGRRARRRGGRSSTRRPHADRAPRAARTPSCAPFARANSRMPLTELWLSNVARNGRRARTGRPRRRAAARRWRSA